MARTSAVSPRLEHHSRPRGADWREHRLRAAAALALIYCCLQGSVGLAWDIEWHRALGRDDFWSPPHSMLYSSVAMAGLLCLAVVLYTSRRHWHGEAIVGSRTTVAIFGVFRAPLGFALATFGVPIMLLAARFDNYWHDVYGLDVALWAPFHMMGLIGGALIILGAIYAIAAEAARARDRGWVHRYLCGFSLWECLTLFAMALLLAQLLIIAQPGFGRFPTTNLGPLRVLTYPALLTLAITVLAVAAVRLTDRPGAGMVLVGLYALQQLFLAGFVPWAIQFVASRQSLQYRTPGQPPEFNLFAMAAAAALLLPALVVDLGALLGGRHDLAELRRAVLDGMAAALPLFLIGTWLTYYVMQNFYALGWPREIVLPPLPPLSAAWWALAPTLAAGALGGALGSGLGAVLRLNTR
jgi:hypothetical protein